ncbi:hypothetical protein L3X38_014389 [Prunus dulcis]|uniref:Uncharacterized protein n=1 Tax=Prunus dulcis TaxID=3755 RepID=A0AAD4ZHY0_PRUDU|nr:hypothetical protein L3X38_014389 [Prunus dulcis]
MLINDHNSCMVQFRIGKYKMHALKNWEHVVPDLIVYKFSMELDQRSSGPHVLIFPLPLQSHVTTTLKFAELLCLANVHITFLNSHFVHNRLLRHTDIQSLFARYTRFRFDSITDGLPDDHPRSGARMLEMFDSVSCVTKPLFREMVLSAQLGLDSWPVLWLMGSRTLQLTLPKRLDL